MNNIDIINLAEALHDKFFVHWADQLYSLRDQVRIILIAGPSGSGKTSTSKRLALQCRVLGMNPKVIELDDYFVEREETPRDENGEYDFECLEAMDLELLGEQLNDLLAGKEVSLPDFDFVTGHKTFGKNIMRLQENDVLIMEGIHALNPAMLPTLDPSKLFRAYVATKSLEINLLRRMIRDCTTRGRTAEDTILMWPKVREGAEKHIIPFKDNADLTFCTSYEYELSALKYYVEPHLRAIPSSSEAYGEAQRLLKLLDGVEAFTPEDMKAIPTSSLLREFIDGQML